MSEKSENAEPVSKEVPSEAIAEWLGIDLPRLRGHIPCSRVVLKTDMTGTRLTCHFEHAPHDVGGMLGLELPPYCSEVELIAEPSQPICVNTKCFSLDVTVPAPCISEIQQQWVVVEVNGGRKLVVTEVDGCYRAVPV